MATLSTPFDANDLKGLARKVVHSKPPRIRTAYRYSADLCNLCAKLLSKEPNARPTLSQILSCAPVLKRMPLIDGSGASAAQRATSAAPPSFSLHKTIVVPTNLEKLKFQLPVYSYFTPPLALSRSLCLLFVAFDLRCANSLSHDSM